METRAVYIRGCGIVSPIGDTQDQIAQACRDTQVTPDMISAPHLSDQPIPYYKISTEVTSTGNNRLYDLIERCVSNAISDANMNSHELEYTSIFSGSTACDISYLEAQYESDLKNKKDPIPLCGNGFGVLAAFVADTFYLGGQEYTFNTACSSSANALIWAAKMIQAGRCEHALVLGVETFNQMSFQGFSSMMLLAPARCQPFDAARSGTLLGEAIGAVVLSSKQPTESVFYTGKPFCFLSGVNLCDTKSITSSNADVVAIVMKQALNTAQLKANQIDVIKTHGTGTQNNDHAEAQAMITTYHSQIPHFTSLKPYLGHTLGACGVVEMIVLLATIKQGFIPKTPNFTKVDPEFGYSPLVSHLEFNEGTLMLNHFGFGGNNSTFIISNRQ